MRFRNIHPRAALRAIYRACMLDDCGHRVELAAASRAVDFDDLHQMNQSRCLDFVLIRLPSDARIYNRKNPSVSDSGTRHDAGHGQHCNGLG